MSVAGDKQEIAQSKTCCRRDRIWYGGCGQLMTANCVVCLDLIHGSTHPQCNVSGHQVYEAEPHDTLVTVYNHLTMKTTNKQHYHVPR